MGIGIGSGFDLSARVPVDSRMIAANYTAAKAIIAANGYVGLQITVTNSSDDPVAGRGTITPQVYWLKAGPFANNADLNTRLVPYLEGITAGGGGTAAKKFVINAHNNNAEVIQHDLDTDDIIVSVFENDSIRTQIVPKIVIIDSNSIRLEFSENFTENLLVYIQAM